ncbi:2-nitropropane dioxygenase [Salmonella enterica subsp. enterica]|uniref:2-nitropropane dioxygenase n=1 Tax=Salmonella enterica I TaxID=59201 RepID=A0A379VQX1_SALET|nr:2-nitropropane dioxygenase [Salmonella enterica subsp. enterica]
MQLFTAILIRHLKIHVLAEKAGADIIVATGFDEGGTLPGTALGTFSIVPLIADSVQSVPVMAAGGLPIAVPPVLPMRWEQRVSLLVRCLLGQKKAVCRSQ